VPLHYRKSCVSAEMGGTGNLSSEGELDELRKSRKCVYRSGLHSARLKDTSSVLTRDIRMISINVLLGAQYLTVGVLPEKLTVPTLRKKFPAFSGTRRLITAFTSARHLSISLARSIQSRTFHPS
jgi:hypothetical protein